MRLGAVGHVVTHAGSERETPAVRELGVERAFQAEQEMTLAAPVIRQVARRILEHAHAHLAEMPRAPARVAVGTRVAGDFDLAPVDSPEGQIGDTHAAPGSQYLPASTSPNTGESTLPPVRVRPMRWPASDSRSRHAAAKA